MKYKSKVVEKEAFKWMHDVVPDWWKSAEGIEIEVASGTALIPTLEGVMRASPGDYIIKGLSGELYSCKPEIFEESYEPA